MSTASLLAAMPKTGSLKALEKLYHALSTQLPSDLQFTRVESPPHIPDATVLHYNYDEGHSARFMVPHTQGGSVSFDYVMNRSQPLAFLMRALAVRAPNQQQAPHDATENVIFMPGLNTFQQPHEGETTTEQRLTFYVRVLQTVPMAQLHPGSSKDQPDTRIDGKSARSLRKIVKSVGPLLPPLMEPRVEGDELVWTSNQLDYMQAALSMADLIDTPLKRRIRDLLYYTKREDAEPLVLVGYSRSSIDLQASLVQHVKESLKSGETESEVQRRLRRLVTAVTIGSGKADFPDGPAYIHIATYQDPLSKLSGVTSKHNASRAGRDAMFINMDAPLAKGSYDTHNFGAVMLHFLAILMHRSGVSGFRQLWMKNITGEVEVPHNMEELVKAMIVMTDATVWLFSAKDAWAGLGDDWLPQPDEAVRVLRENMGDPFVDALVANFGQPKEPRFGPRSVASESKCASAATDIGSEIASFMQAAMDKIVGMMKW
eukprot:TRINITY_DN976_c0_g3_i1.p1 TRINITY_DN976_c0_g3~~TRINITY_DN976_c0_g3_i1.p1  ORF type:complete len:487 (+),score=96.45 TRINITY_DN976_c0_g3_i1:1336-2796(+)